MGDNEPPPPPDPAQRSASSPLPGADNLDSPGCHESSEGSMTEEMDSDSEFTVVTGHRLKRKLRRTSTTSEMMAGMPTGPKVFTVGYVPFKKTDNLNTLNRQKLTEYFRRVAVNQVKEIRINARLNVLMADVTTDGIIDTLKAITGLGNIQVRSFLAHGKETTTGVISDVDPEINDSDLVQLLSSTVRILDIHRIGRSRCVKVVFQCDSLPASVKVGYVRHRVRPYVPRPLQCYKCQKLGHVSAACKNAVACKRCGDAHDHVNCKGTLKCANCSGPHEATSNECPKMMHERRVLRTMVRDNSTHREAAASVRRRRRSSRRRRRQSRSISRPRDLQTTAAPPLAPLPQVLTQEEPRPPPVPPRRANIASGTVSADDWPLLPQTVSAANKSAIVVKGPHEKHSNEERIADEKVLRMLKQLLNTMRKLIAGLKSQSAKIVVQVLDALEPLIEALQ
ncbi:hypothetical protein HPB48_022664 [Haemaphysalis longicornis]|uniref:CCHC-type domain-containing protein n=1 Tax=Haemaphysalis longicornis TaxID=44386 RepID=A0A9J6FYW9_HAELO|nr:hypothetical protein HPB48_022664 [Haemaphysalis longicornis]